MNNAKRPLSTLATLIFLVLSVLVLELGPHDAGGAPRVAPPKRVRLVQVTDTHLFPDLPGGSCEPAVPNDGRTDCVAHLVQYTEECADGDCPWIDPNTGQTIAPTIALQDAVPLINSFKPDLVVFTGDLVSPQDCGEYSAGAFAMLRPILDGLDCAYRVIGAQQHDNVDSGRCRALYEEQFGADGLNWWWQSGEVLAVGLSEVNGAFNDKYDRAFAEAVLAAHAGRNMTLLVFTHIPLNHTVHDVLGEVIDDYKEGYAVVIAVAGHTHANKYREVDGVHYVTTTATMNYPTEFRVLDIYETRVEAFMGPTINEALSLLSLEIIQSAMPPGDPERYYGKAEDRSITIPVEGRSPTGGRRHMGEADGGDARGDLEKDEYH